MEVMPKRMENGGANMNIFQRLLQLFKANTAKHTTVNQKRTVKNLQINDVVTVDLEDYIVVGKIEYNDSGYTWTSYNLKGDNKNIWLSYEEDDELYIGVYESSSVKIQEPIGNKITVEGITFTLDEKGSASITGKEGQAGAVVGQRVKYWDFESEDSEFDLLSIEKWGGQTEGGEIEVSKGYSINEKEIKIIAGT